MAEKTPDPFEVAPFEVADPLSLPATIRIGEIMADVPMKSDIDEPSVGVAAFSRVNGWEVEVDEATTGKVRWFARIEGPLIHMYFEISSPLVMRKLADLLQYPENSCGELLSEVDIGVLNGAPVVVFRDDEFSDRYFIWNGMKDGFCIRICLSGDNLIAFSSAVRQVADELAS